MTKSSSELMLQVFTIYACCVSQDICGNVICFEEISTIIIFVKLATSTALSKPLRSFCHPEIDV